MCYHAAGKQCCDLCSHADFTPADGLANADYRPVRLSRSAYPEPLPRGAMVNISVGGRDFSPGVSHVLAMGFSAPEESFLLLLHFSAASSAVSQRTPNQQGFSR